MLTDITLKPEPSDLKQRIIAFYYLGVINSDYFGKFDKGLGYYKKALELNKNSKNKKLQDILTKRIEDTNKAIEEKNREKIVEKNEIPAYDPNIPPIVVIETKRGWLPSLDGPVFVVQCALLYRGGNDLFWLLKMTDKHYNVAFSEEVLLENGLDVIESATKKCIEWSTVALKNKVQIDKKGIDSFRTGVQVYFSSSSNGENGFLNLENPSWIRYGEKTEITPFVVPNEPMQLLMGGYDQSQTLGALKKRLSEARKEYKSAVAEHKQKDKLFK